MTPIANVEQLIARFESSAFDYKTNYDLTNRAGRSEIAKDVAAFANAFGGTLVVGVTEKGGKILALPGVADVGALTREVATALRQYCAPVPSTPIEHAIVVVPADARRILTASGVSAAPGDVTLVTLNVEPDPRAPVGVRALDPVSQQPNSDTFRFPVRIDDQTRFMDPTELPMWMNSAERRTAILLNRALTAAGPGGARVRVFHAREGGQGALTNRPFVLLSDLSLMQLERVDEERLVVVFSECIDRPAGPVRVPLAYVSAVWQEAADDAWSMSVRGTLYPGEPGQHFRFKPLGGM